MHTRAVPGNPYVLPGILIVLYSYMYSMILSFAHVRAALMPDPQKSLVLFKTDLIPYAAGLIMFVFLFSRRRGSTAGAGAALAIPLLLIVIFFTDTPGILFLCVYLAMFLCGIIGGFSCCTLAGLFGVTEHTGKLFGICLSIAVILQYILQTAVNSTPAMLYTLIVASFAAALMIVLISGKTDNTPEITVFGNRSAVYRSLITTAFLVLCFEYLSYFLAYQLVSMVSERIFLVYEFPRLFVIPGYLIMGICADIRRMKYIPLVTLCGTLFAVLNPVLFQSETYEVLNACLFYVVVGIINSYLAFGFWRILYAANRPLYEAKKHLPGADGRDTEAAADMKAAADMMEALPVRLFACICVLGRIMDSICSVIFTDSMIAGLSLPVMIFAELVVIIVIIIMMALTGQFTFLLPAADAPAEGNNAADLKRFAAAYNLTDRETDILEKTLTHRGTMTALAKDLYISRSVLYKHIRSVCEKTDRETFEEVMTLYYSGEYAKEGAVIPFATSSAAPSVPAAASGQNEVQVPAQEDMGALCSEFARMYHLTDNEAAAFTLFIDNPGLTQKELAAIRGCTLRTMQRYMAGIRQKTGTSTLAECMTLYHRFINRD